MFVKAQYNIQLAVCLPCRTLASHQHLIEDALFNKDIDTFGRSLCVEILGICDPHQIYDAGEL